MVKIRLTRTGKKHEPHYRIVAVDSRAARDAKYIEKIGYYNPRTNPSTLKYDKDILKKWIDNGAQMTDTVHDIFVREGVVKQNSKRTKRLELIMKPKEPEKEKGDVEPKAKPKAKKEAKPDKEPSKETKATGKPKEKTTEKESPKPDEKKETEPPKSTKKAAAKK